MKHLIIGNGNLALDLKLCLPGASQASRSLGHSLSKILKMAEDADVVWYTIGHGSVSEANAAPDMAVELHCGYPLKLAKISNRLMYFSTDYVKSTPKTVNPKSMYALSKWMFEQAICRLSIDNVTVFRVGSLYGTHKPEKTFMHRVVTYNKKNPGVIELPSNVVTPTPTSWIAQEVVKNLDCAGEVYEIAPSGGVEVWEWAKTFWPEREFVAGNRDRNRPEVPTLVHSFGSAPDWSTLWAGNSAFWSEYVRRIQQ